MKDLAAFNVFWNAESILCCGAVGFCDALDLRDASRNDVVFHANLFFGVSPDARCV